MWFAARVFSDVAALLPAGRRLWATAVMAEFEAIEGARARVVFAFSASIGLLRIALYDVLRGRLADADLVVAASVSGALIAALDLVVPSRTPLILLLAIACLASGILRPGAAWRWGSLLALPLPLLVITTGWNGPYAHDGGDVWYPLLPSVLLSTFAGAVLRPMLQRFVPRLLA